MAASALDMTRLASDIKRWGEELGFQQLAITDVDLGAYEPHLRNWIASDYHGEMHYLANNHELRSRPDRLLPGTTRVICARMDYARQADNSLDPMARRDAAYIARYARGRDYHKLIRKRLQRLAARIEDAVGEFGYRAFVDSAPVLERALAEKAGLGWIGKNTMLINRQAGSWFFLGELFTDLPLPLDEPAEPHCGSCRACLDVCPTDAFVSANQLDARRCISYLTIELRGSIPVEFRRAMGNRVFGCDDCNLICPWNKFTRMSEESDFAPRHGFDDAGLVALFGWSEQQFLDNTAGSAIRRTGYEGWLRNLAVGLGNADTSAAVVAALENRRQDPSAIVREHVEWALAQHRTASQAAPMASPGPHRASAGQAIRRR